MQPDISEFSYGFALTNEIVGWAKLNAAPIFPSLIEEGKKGGGYDVKLQMPGVPLYLQFKRADCMLRSIAYEISKYNADLSLPFYRFHITESGKSNQHILLQELDDGLNQVFYAAPRFHQQAEIDEAWEANAIAGASIFVRPKDVGDLDEKRHHVAYDTHNAYLCSAPKLLPSLSAAALAEVLEASLERNLQPLRENLPEYERRLDHAWIRGKARVAETKRGIGEAQLSIPLRSADSALPGPQARVESHPPPEIRAPRRVPEELEPLRRLANAAMTRFHSQLIIVQRTK